jgi:hypothetical protein
MLIPQLQKFLLFSVPDHAPKFIETHTGHTQSQVADMNPVFRKIKVLAE